MNERLLTIMKKLEKNPHLIARLEVLLDVTENTSGDIELAKDAENQIYEEIMKMGNDLLTTWGKSQERKKSKVYEEKSNAIKHGKKKRIG